MKITMNRDSYLLIGMVLFVTVLVIADYLLELHIYEKITASPDMLKSPNEVANQ